MAIRVAPDLWQRFGEVAGSDRTKLLIAFMRWYVRQDGAKLPQRPAETA